MTLRLKGWSFADVWRHRSLPKRRTSVSKHYGITSQSTATSPKLLWQPEHSQTEALLPLLQEPEDCPCHVPEDCPCPVPEDSPCTVPEYSPSTVPEDCPCLEPEDCPCLEPEDCLCAVPEDCPCRVPEDSLCAVSEDCPCPVPEDSPCLVPQDCPYLVLEDSSSPVPEDRPCPVTEDCPYPVPEQSNPTHYNFEIHFTILALTHTSVFTPCTPQPHTSHPLDFTTPITFGALYKPSTCNAIISSLLFLHFTQVQISSSAPYSPVPSA